jgi:hypothetical protein
VDRRRQEIPARPARVSSVMLWVAAVQSCVLCPQRAQTFGPPVFLRRQALVDVELHAQMEIAAAAAAEARQPFALQP